MAAVALWENAPSTPAKCGDALSKSVARRWARAVSAKSASTILRGRRSVVVVEERARERRRTAAAQTLDD